MSNSLEISPKEWVTVVVSLMSLATSLVALARATPRLTLNIWLGKLHTGGIPDKSDDPYLYIQVVNISTRPVTIKTIGGHYNGRVFRIMQQRLPFFGTCKSFVFGQEVLPILFEANKPKILRDGESVSHHIKVNLFDANGNSAGINMARCLWVSDAAGREYPLPRRALKKLKSDLTTAIRSARMGQS